MVWPLDGCLEGVLMDNTVDISKITADLEKKFNGNANHDVKVIQDYCKTLPRCEESAKLVVALGQYAAKKFPEADTFKLAKKIESTIAELEKGFGDDPDKNVEMIRNYCTSLPRSDENTQIVIALGQYASQKFPEAEEIKKSKEEFEKLQATANQLQQRVKELQDFIKANDFDKAIETIQGMLLEVPMPKVDEGKRLVSFSHPFEEILFRSTHKNIGECVRVSNLVEMLKFQLGSLLAEKGRYDEARQALHESIELNPVSAHARLELARVDILEKKYDDAFNVLNEVYPLIFARPLLAAYYCFLAEVVENLDKNYALAVGYVYASIGFADNKRAHEVLNRLAKNSGVDLAKPKEVDLRKMAEEANLPVGPSQAVCSLAVQAAKQMKTTYPDVAKQLFAIAYELTQDPGILKELRKMN